MIVIKIVFFLSLFLDAITFAQDNIQDYICTVFEGDSKSYFHCTHKDSGEFLLQAVDPSSKNELTFDLKSQGAKFVTQDKYAVHMTERGLRAIWESQEPLKSCLLNATYSSKAFASPPEGVLQDLKDVARALIETGICQLDPIKHKSRIQGLGITTPNDLLEHFLCIANNESTLGKHNTSNGGFVGAFMINKAHSKKGKACAEIEYYYSDKKKYHTYQAKLQSARCALELYKENGLNDWGSFKSSWGSNRKCLSKNKSRFRFIEKMNYEYCCDCVLKKSIHL